MQADAAAQAAGLLPVNKCVTNFPQIGKLQLDMMVLAYSCDITRVASMQWSTAESTVVHTWLPNPPFDYLKTVPLPAIAYTGTQEHHMLTHNETVAVSALNMTYNPDNPALMTLNQATVNTVRAAVASAASGCGLTRLYSYHVAEYVRDGRLKIVLADAEHPPLPVHLLTPPGRTAVPKVRAFIDFAVPRLRSEFARIAADAGTRLR
jgi:hypothetical protein